MLQSGESAMDFEEFDDLQAASVRRAEAVKGSKALRSMITTEFEIFALFSHYWDVTVHPRHEKSC
jgi:hypothetical protein